MLQDIPIFFLYFNNCYGIVNIRYNMNSVEELLLIVKALDFNSCRHVRTAVLEHC